MRLALFLVLIGLISAADSYKILVFSPRYSQSLNNYLGNIADTLVDAGHNVTTLIPIINPHLRDGTHKSNKIYVQPNDSSNFEEADFFDYNDFNMITSVPFGRDFMGWVNAECAGVLDEPGLMQRLKAAKFDVMILENFETCGVAISHLIKPKSLITTAGSVPMGQQGTDLGMASALSYNPSAIISNLDVHSMWSRMWNLYAYLVFDITWSTSRTEIDALFKKRYGPAFPSVNEIGSHAAFSFVNSESLIDFATPTLSRVVPIGGIGAKEANKLEGEFDRIFNLRSKTVLISFGSIVQSHALPLQVKQNILKTVARFPEVTFLWKYEKPNDEFATNATASTPNLHIQKWTPQNDILADKRLTAFISHGGMASTQETSLRGKPGLFVPFIGDQPRNAGMMQKNGLGKVYHKQDLYDAEKVYAAVKDLLENESYYKNAAKIAEMIAKKPFSSKELLVKTVEFAAQFGPSPALRPQSFDMSWMEYNNVDIIAVFAGTVLIVAISALKVTTFVLEKVLRIVKLKEE